MIEKALAIFPKLLLFVIRNNVYDVTAQKRELKKNLKRTKEKRRERGTYNGNRKTVRNIS
ncbi:hypothetical protein SAMN05216391_11915 [Lachnospiraceae bacterium KHCPX20]|nr:hypothetical protein SAMN05216391_11915 [Lachnospiraceae bacterium KHCPX20]